MRVRRIGYERPKNPVYSPSEKLLLEVELEDWERVEETFEYLQKETARLLGLDEKTLTVKEEIEKANTELYNLKLEGRRVLTSLKQLKRNFEIALEVLQARGYL